ncbi:tetratricopeptide repeat protein [Streptomyces sp. CA-278952]|uniref:tetratricopeptide repeat protein n=1 Tax=unclassified Streptomyces TaxID=2593676 RepID=UPI002242878B|nr:MULTISPECIES: tetratricopeptide repeat protein [unclassified Streptomyces]UZI29695.1 tetratricopeptide repeat protein [Streptomyces sp. VB1]WDG29655.1 tetratricopeptide repeat protein [Streptomyces sp. CA-278952]
MNGSTEGRAEGNGRVFQSAGDQHITEHHHHGQRAFPPGPAPDSVRRPAVGRAPVVLRDRLELMTQLRSALEDGGAEQVYVLHGLGGCGKTAVASEAFRIATGEGDRVGLWVNAPDLASLRAGMLAVAADRGAGEGELAAARNGLRAAADLVWERLDRSDQPWLLVIDNADAPAILREGNWLRTSPRGITLVTTRQVAAHWWPGATLHHVGVLPREDAAQVLCDLAPERGTAEEAAEIADRLGRLPLALTLAGGFLAHQVISPWSMAEYGQALDRGNEVDHIELLDQGAAYSGGDASRHLASTTWELSLDALRAQGLPQATMLVRLLSCWSHDPLPLQLLTGSDIDTVVPRARVESALRGLLDHSLTRLAPGPPRCLRTHGVLLDSIARSTPADQHDVLVRTAAELLGAVVPDVSRPWAREDPTLAPYVPHTLALLRRATQWAGVGPAALARVLECTLRLAVALHRAGDYASALSVAQDAVARGTQVLEASHPAVIAIRQRAGRSLYRLGRYEEAEAAHRLALADCTAVFGASAVETLESCAGLSPVLVWVLDQKDEAVALVRRAVEGRTALLGPTHPSTLIARTYLLEFTAGPETHPDAGAALVADCRSEVGPGHPITLDAELNHGFALVTAGRQSQALPLVRGVVTGSEHTYGIEHPKTLAARSLLSRVLGELGQFQEAAEQAGLVAEARARVLGAGHPWTQWSLDRLAERRHALDDGRSTGGGDEGQTP